MIDKIPKKIHWGSSPFARQSDGNDSDLNFDRPAADDECTDFCVDNDDERINL
jgi:hypothetical protein